MIRGSYFDARQARSAEAHLVASGDGRWRLLLPDQELLLDPAEVTVSDRIGSIPRRLRLPGGAEFETLDNDGVDALLGIGAGGTRGLVNTLERRWGIALASLVAVALISVLTVKYGLPAMAGWASQRVPPQAERAIGDQVLTLLDRTMMKPSNLPASEQQHLRLLFADMTRDIDDGHAYRLELRFSDIGANALALPSGIVLVTDELVNLAQHDEELMAVLAHEIGHVRGRHSLRLLLQNAGVSALALVLVGDVGTISAIATSAAPVMLQARYSRQVEIEADGFARAWLQERGIEPTRFDDILCRMVAASLGDGSGQFLSTHPPPNERARCEEEQPETANPSP